MIDPFEEARAVELDERLRTERRGHFPAAELLRAATADGHAALGWPEAGRIEPGALADLVTVSLDSVRLAGAQPETLLESVLFAASPRTCARCSWAAGASSRTARHATLDVPAELRAAIGAVLPRAVRR